MENIKNTKKKIMVIYNNNNKIKNLKNFKRKNLKIEN